MSGAPMHGSLLPGMLGVGFGLVPRRIFVNFLTNENIYFNMKIW